MPTADRILLDTHVLLRWKAGSGRLSAEAADHIRTAAELLVSPVSCWEVAMLTAIGRVQLDRPTWVWVEDVLAGTEVGLAELTASAAVAAAELPGFHGDPVDRFVVATAEALGVPLVTKDQLIHALRLDRADLRVIW